MPLVRASNAEDSIPIAQIHRREIATGFLSHLGVRFLKELYRAMASSQCAFCVVAEDEESREVLGFASGSTDVGKFYKEFLMKHGFKAALISLPRFVTPLVLRKVFETMKYPSAGGSELPGAELLSIAVKGNATGKGIAQELVKALIEEFRKRGVEKIKVVVGAGNERANRLYRRIGFEFHSITQIHKGELSNVYIMRIPSKDQQQ